MIIIFALRSDAKMFMLNSLRSDAEMFMLNSLLFIKPFGVFQVPANSPATTAFWGMDNCLTDPIRMDLGFTAKISVIVWG